ncbi:MAG: tetratricopeptide repeat protein [Anaerolineaceae bacterium]|nr:tetratricopeptide repeat protein [Anaerolineaceae bacterium]
MNRHVMRYLIIVLALMFVVSSVYAQQTKPSDKQAQADYADAQKAESAGNYDEAVKLYGQVIDTEPDFWPAYYKRGEAYASLQNYESAVKDYSHVIDVVPDYAQAYAARAVAYEQLYDHEQALADSNKAIELNTNDDFVYFNRGMAYLGLKEYEKSIADFTYWIDLNPKMYAMSYFYRSRAYYAVSNLKGVIADLDVFIELQPKSAAVLADRAFVQRLLGNYDEAIADYTQAIDLKPDDLDQMYYNRGQLYGLQGQYDKMLADLREYAKLAGSNADTTVLDLLHNHPQ